MRCYPIARPPIEKRLHAILTPHLRRNAARPAVTRTVFGAAFCALALASFRVGAAPERPARHLPASAVTAISPHQTPSPSHPPARSSATVHHASAHSGTHDAELSTMRRQLEQFRRLLLQNQQENRALRQEVKDQSARLHEIQNEAIRILDPGLPPEHVGTQQHPPAQTNANHKLPLTALQQAEIESVKLTLSDLQQQRTLLQQRLEQARALYTAGASGPNPLTQTQAELKNNEYEIDSTSARLSDLEAGIHRSQQEIQRATLRTQLKKLRTYLVEQQGALRIASERHRAGLATAADVNDAQQSISRTRIEIDRLQLQLLESN
jgi:predicted nuclease with TOPRIM domain